MADGGSIFERLTGDERPPAVVVAVQLPGVTEAEMQSSIAELERLARTLGLDPIGQVVQRRGRLASGVVLGEGKLKELATWTGGTGEVPVYERPGAKKTKDQLEAEEVAEADEEDDDPDPDDAEGDDVKPPAKATVVLVDHDLTPTQHRNLEKATGVDVLDRTSVILEIFHRHAKTREARLQVEIARLRYLAPRLREGSGGGDRVRGGVGG
jgi:GTP-binding protein HflX